MARLRFGPAGVPVDYRGPVEGVPAFLKSIGLDAFEYEAVRGVRISEEKARRLGSQASNYDIFMSLHAPYYVNLASPQAEVVERSVARVVESMVAAEWMGGEAVVVHSGYYKGNKTREEALERVVGAYVEVLERLPAFVKKPFIAPETMGKTSQVGGLEETVEICRRVGRCKPCVDWAHMHARSEGGFPRSIDDIVKSIEFIERELGSHAVKPLHTHFSKIKYGKGGEREHVVLSDEKHGPDWRLVCRAILETGVETVVISESPILEKDAILMKKICGEEAKIKGLR
ncbi:MAG: TIM barrel protein [Thermoprotei archaeon]|nr:TIM barrel protein [Thermoprotei archaeon]